MTMNDAISGSLGLQPMDEVVEAKVVTKRTPVTSEVSTEVTTKMSADMKLDNDYEYARANFYNIIESGSEALEQMLDVAKASEHPRAYEVVSTIMKTLIDSNKELVAMSSKKAKDSEEVPADSGKPVTNNNLFVGSTSELQQMLKDLRNNESSE
tara:strand:+ start:1727 stop:2188 length:462 start_codon:yes stop_codon:yes gene_type:complete